MFTNSINTDHSSFHATMPAVARRQLHMSIGAVAVIAMVAIGTAVGMRSAVPTAGETAARATNAQVIVRAAVREVPSERMQATDQTRPDRRS